MSVWLSVCLGVWFMGLMMENQPSADNLCFFYGLLPSCSVWAINLSPAISKQCSNQWEIISVNRWWPAFLFLPHSTSPALCLYPFLPPVLSLSRSTSLLSHFCCLCFSTHSFTQSTPQQPPHPHSLPSSAAPTLKCDSSAATDSLTKILPTWKM